jgi:hypothetical protein
MPVEQLEVSGWVHSQRLPLGGEWSGHCAAPGHEGETPSPEELREFCNLGYAASCGRLPQQRPWDSIRFAAKSAGISPSGEAGEWIRLRYVCERDHRPADHGWLEFHVPLEQWKAKHENACVQRLAECFLQSWMRKKKLPQQMTAAAV